MTTVFNTIAAALCLWLVAVLPAQARAADCAQHQHEDRRYTVCRIDPAAEELRLFLNRPDATLIGSFSSLRDLLRDRDRDLTFAMNAGMYHPDRSPVGLYIENGREIAPVVATPGPGNFGLLPNGVLCLNPDTARVIETLRYVEQAPDCDFATQSGPMLVIDGALHPRFLPDSDSRFVRNGVGVDAAGQVFFAISDQRVTFHEFARLFRDVLNTPNALYLDGKVSRLYAPQIGRNDLGFALGPMVGSLAPRPNPGPNPDAPQAD